MRMEINFNHCHWGSRDSDTKLLYMLAESYGTSLSHTKLRWTCHMVS